MFGGSSRVDQIIMESATKFLKIDNERDEYRLLREFETGQKRCLDEPNDIWEFMGQTFPPDLVREIKDKIDEHYEYIIKATADDAVKKYGVRIRVS